MGDHRREPSRRLLRQYAHEIKCTLAKYEAPYMLTVATNIGYALCEWDQAFLQARPPDEIYLRVNSTYVQFQVHRNDILLSQSIQKVTYFVLKKQVVRWSRCHHNSAAPISSPLHP